jgi:hypothetical protein
MTFLDNNKKNIYRSIVCLLIEYDEEKRVSQSHGQVRVATSQEKYHGLR